MGMDTSEYGNGHTREYTQQKNMTINLLSSKSQHVCPEIHNVTKTTLQVISQRLEINTHSHTFFLQYQMSAHPSRPELVYLLQ